MLLRSSTPFSVFECSTLLSLGLLPLLVSSSLAGIPWLWPSPTTRGLSDNAGLTFTASCSVLSGPPCLALVAFLSYSGRFHNLFLISLILKPEPCGQSCQVLLFARGGTCFKYIFTNFLFSIFFFFPLNKFGCPETWSVDQTSLELRGLTVSPSWVLEKKGITSLHPTLS